MASQRVRQSPFGGGGGDGNMGGGLTGAPMPAGRVSAPAAVAAPADMNLDWMEQEFAPPTQAPVHQPQAPQPSFRQQPQAPQQQFAQPGHFGNPMGQPGMQQQFGQEGAAMLAGSMGAMGMNSMMADVVANRIASEMQVGNGQIGC